MPHTHGEHQHDHGHHAQAARGPQLADIVPGLELPATPTCAVDVGCGAGDDARWLAGSGFAAIGIDANPKTLAGAAAALTAPGANVTWLEAHATSLPLDDRSCVLVTDRGCLHHLPTDQRGAYATEVARVLAPGGAWLIRDVVGNHHQIATLSFAAIDELAATASLHVERCELLDNLGPHQWLLAVLRRA